MALLGKCRLLLSISILFRRKQAFKEFIKVTRNLLLFGRFSLGFLDDRNIGIGILPKCHE